MDNSSALRLCVTSLPSVRLNSFDTPWGRDGGDQGGGIYPIIIWVKLADIH